MGWPLVCVRKDAWVNDAFRAMALQAKLRWQSFCPSAEVMWEVIIKEAVSSTIGDGHVLKKYLDRGLLGQRISPFLVADCRLWKKNMQHLITGWICLGEKDGLSCSQI